MRACVRWAVIGLALAVVACDGERAEERARADALAARVDQLEKRLATAERTVEPLEQTRNEVASVDRRVSTLETTVHELAAHSVTTPPGSPQAATPPAAATPPTTGTGPGSGPAMWGGPTTRPVRDTRRAQLRALSDEFRSRLAQIRDDSKDGSNQQQKIQDTLEWYRTQRRAILRGEPRTDQ